VPIALLVGFVGLLLFHAAANDQHPLCSIQRALGGTCTHAPPGTTGAVADRYADAIGSASSGGGSSADAPTGGGGGGGDRSRGTNTGERPSNGGKSGAGKTGPDGPSGAGSNRDYNAPSGGVSPELQRVINDVWKEFGSNKSLRSLGGFVCKCIGGTCPGRGISQHSYGNAIDIGIGTDMKLGDEIHNWLKRNAPAECENLWRIPDHYDHVHFSLAPCKRGCPPKCPSVC
jgi:hypothetical protein